MPPPPFLFSPDYHTPIPGRGQDQKNGPRPKPGSVQLFLTLVGHVLTEIHEDLSHLSPGGGAGGGNLIAAHAGDQAGVYRPAHGLRRPAGDGGAVGVSGQVTGSGDVIALVLGEPVQDQGQLLPGEGVVGAEAGLAHAGDHAVGRRPVHRGGIPVAGGHIREARGGGGGAALHGVQGLDQHGPGEGVVGGEPAAGHAGHEAVFIHVLHRVIVPGGGGHVGKGGLGDLGLTALPDEGGLHGHLAAGHGEGEAGGAAGVQVNLVAPAVGDHQLVQLIAVVGVDGDGHGVALVRPAGLDGDAASADPVHGNQVVAAVRAARATVRGAVGLVAGPVGCEGCVRCNGYACAFFMQIVVHIAPPAVEGVADAVSVGQSDSCATYNFTGRIITVIAINKCYFIDTCASRFVRNTYFAARTGVFDCFCIVIRVAIRIETRIFIYLISRGFRNISIDLIYGLPGQTLEDWKKDICRTLQLDVQHVSAYGLSYEEGTPLYIRYQNKEIVPSDDDLYNQMYDVMCVELQRAGFERYEVSNFAKPYCRSRHNSSYWHDVPYMGIGPGAHSYNGRARQWNVENLPLYMETLEAGRLPAEEEQIDRTTHFNETLMLALRTAEGLDLSHLARIFGQKDADECLQKAQIYIAKGFLCLRENNLVPTQLGFHWLNAMIADLMKDV